MSARLASTLPDHVTPAFLAAFDAAIQALEEACRFAISLSPKERRRLRAFGSESEALAPEVIEAAARHAKLLPAHRGAAEIARRYQATVELLRRVTRVDELRQRLWDTARVSGDGCVGLMLETYQRLKLLAPSEGIEATVESLGRHFAHKAAAGRANGAKRRASAARADGGAPTAPEGE